MTFLCPVEPPAPALALSREILSEDRLSQLAISDDIAGLRMLYLTARGRATEGTT